MMSKRLCIFLHYFTGDFYPLYVQYYLNELSLYFDEVRLVTNERAITHKAESFKENVTIQFVKNEGYDLGMFYKAFHEIDPNNYSQIACVNDSNIVFGELQFLFDWAKYQTVDFWGLVDSWEKPWFSTHENNYHIQSHFVVFNREAIALLPEYFSQLDYTGLIHEDDVKIVRRNVINDWEIGVSQFLMNQNLTCRAYIESSNLAKDNGVTKPINVMHKYYCQLIKQGLPIMKKKVLFSEKWMDQLYHKKNCIGLIKEYGSEKWDISALIEELEVLHDLSIGKRKFKHLRRINQIFCG